MTAGLESQELSSVLWLIPAFAVSESGPEPAAPTSGGTFTCQIEYVALVARFWPAADV